MRRIAFFLAVFVASVPAAAQGWTEYNYPSYSFAVSFPADPRSETSTYQAADGRSAQAQVYSVTQDDAVFKMTIVDLSDAAMEESAVIDHAIKTLSQGGEIKVDIPARINRVYGRQLSIVGADGSRSSAAVFFHKGRLYQIEGGRRLRGMKRHPGPSASSNRSSSPAASRTGRTRFGRPGGIVEAQLKTPVRRAPRPRTKGNCGATGAVVAVRDKAATRAGVNAVTAGGRRK